MTRRTRRELRAYLWGCFEDATMNAVLVTIATALMLGWAAAAYFGLRWLLS